MARIRTIKPEFFRHEGLQDLASEHGAHVMLVFAGLWGHCDRFGRFECRPRHLKLDILPFIDFDMSETLSALESSGFIQTYEVDGKRYGVIPSFAEHQRFGGKEASEPSKYPEPPVKIEGSNGEAMGNQSVPLERKWNKGREGNGVEAREKFPASPKPKPKPEPVSSKANSENQAKGTRWPTEAVVPDDWLVAGGESRANAGMVAIDLRAEAVKFANYWASKAGGGATKLNWKRTWINWCLQARGAPHAKPTLNGHSGRSIFAEIGDELAAREARDGVGGLAEAD